MPATCPGGRCQHGPDSAQGAVAGMARSIKLHGLANGNPCMASLCAMPAALSRTPRDP